VTTANRLPWTVDQRGGHFLPGSTADNQHEAGAAASPRDVQEWSTDRQEKP
jgi:hypothetical protein